jgi:hypothetical protein
MKRPQDSNVDDQEEHLTPGEWQRIAATVRDATARFAHNGHRPHETADELREAQESAEQQTEQVD